MTNTEIIESLATELKRLDKMPKGWTLLLCPNIEIYDPEDIEALPMTFGGQATIAALSGIAAMICSYDQRTPVHSAKGYWIILDPTVGEDLGGVYDTYHDALIAALKLVDKEDVKECLV